MYSIKSALYDRVMLAADRSGLWKWRRQLLEPVAGEVVEIGAGTGLNLRHYTSAVERLVLTDPQPAALERARGRLAEPTAATVELLTGAAEAIPLPDASVDWVVSTLVFCSVTDLDLALGEVRRVLRPGGGFVFCEHVADHDPAVLRRQQRWEPLWRRVAGNCHFTRRTGEAILAAGFEPELLRRQHMHKAPALVRPTVRGIVRKTG
jgi:ubiquinone/menaquinone biosynthesis C-methylase UbiE